MLRLLPLLLCSALFPLSALAHQLDEYLQATLVSIEPGHIRLKINLTPGVAIAEQVLTLLDYNRDGIISTNEVERYAETFQRDLVAELDTHPLKLKLTSSDSSATSELRTGFGLIRLEFSLALNSLPRGAHRLTLDNRHLQPI